MRRRVHIWFIALFFAALVLPFPLFWLLQGGLDTSNHENRALTTWQDCLLYTSNKPYKSPAKDIANVSEKSIFAFGPVIWAVWFS